MLSSRYTSLGMSFAQRIVNVTDTASRAFRMFKTPGTPFSSSSSRTSVASARAACFSKTSSSRVICTDGTAPITPKRASSVVSRCKSPNSSLVNISLSSYKICPPRTLLLTSTFSKISSHVWWNCSNNSEDEGPAGSSTCLDAFPARTTRGAFTVATETVWSVTTPAVPGGCGSCRGGFALCEGRSAVTWNTSGERFISASLKALPWGGRFARGSVLDLRSEVKVSGRLR